VAFNASTYRRNQWRKQALAELSQAREIKARVAAGNAYDWEAPRIALCVSLARSTWRLYLSQRRICEIERGIKKL
jgi:hypothetical protein